MAMRKQYRGFVLGEAKIYEKLEGVDARLLSSASWDAVTLQDKEVVELIDLQCYHR